MKVRNKGIEMCITNMRVACVTRRLRIGMQQAGATLSFYAPYTQTSTSQEINRR
jgi:hypothetical protein